MLSAIVISKNEEERVEACLKSLKWADEIIVVDNGSSDETVNISKKYTQKVYVVEVESFAELRNKAMEKVSGDWVLYVDSDERVLKDLREEIIELIAKNDAVAYAISRKNIIFGTEVSYGPFFHDWVIRLLKKSEFEGWIGDVHEQPKFKGKLGYTKNSLLHLTHRNLDQIVLKSLEFSKIDSKLRYAAKHPRMSGWRFLRIFVTEIFNQGVLRRGFISGTVGVMDSLLQIFSMVMTYIRLWELQRQEKLSETYNKIDENLIKKDFTL